ncbi:MAG: hypothetical protein K2N73_08395 [Lachnospiraceae bacterium]|nr:hypothetical protein [Lachnospiraceae bacterium]
MENQMMTALTDIIIEGAGSYQSILSLKINTAANEENRFRYTGEQYDYIGKRFLMNMVEKSVTMIIQTMEDQILRLIRILIIIPIQ